MERRLFLKSLLGLAGAAAVGATFGSEALALPISQPAGGSPREAPQDAVATPDDVAEAKVDNVQYYYRRRRRYVVRRYYRPRVVVRRVYRPRVVVRRYYYRPVRRRYIVRRRYYW